MCREFCDLRTMTKCKKHNFLIWLFWCILRLLCWTHAQTTAPRRNKTEQLTWARISKGWFSNAWHCSKLHLNNHSQYNSIKYLTWSELCQYWTSNNHRHIRRILSITRVLCRLQASDNFSYNRWINHCLFQGLWVAQSQANKSLLHQREASCQKRGLGLTVLLRASGRINKACKYKQTSLINPSWCPR